MTTDTLIAAGFTDPVFQSQAAFRALLSALSEPGLPQDVAEAFAPPAGLNAATAIALLTLADYETPIWLPETLRDGPAAAWLRFHCGAALIDDPAAASFAVIDGASDATPLSAFNPGTDQFADRSTTVIVQCAALDGGAATTLAGPGIAGQRTIAPQGLPQNFRAQLAANAEIYPLGVDLILSCGDAVIGLPRSTQVVDPTDAPPGA